MSPKPPGSETRIQLVYPKVSQEIYEESTFLMGQVSACPAGAYLELATVLNENPNAVRIPLSPQGFFAWKVPIHAGMNPLTLSVRLNSASPPIAQELMALHGAPPLAVLPLLPLAVHEETLQPASDVWLTESDTLTVSCSASVEAQVSLEIPGFLSQSIPVPPMNTAQPFVDNREAIFAQLHWTHQRTPTQGYYQLKLPVNQLLQLAGKLPLSKEYQDLPLILVLRHGDDVLKMPLPGKLSVLLQSCPAIVIQDRAVTRTSPESGARLTQQRQNTEVKVDGLQQGWARVRLSADEAFYISADALEFQDSNSVKSQPLSLVSIHAEALNEIASVVKLAFGNGGSSKHPPACPIQMEAIPSTAMNRLQVRLYGVCSRCDFIHYPANNEVVRHIHWRPVAEDVLELWIDLHQALSGYDYAWQDGQWQFTVKILPKRLADIRILIDPGHGGSETGSTGLNGLQEKDLNLAVSRLFRDALLKAGFEQVTLTRNTDEELPLAERGSKVIQTEADIVLSMHHNALPDGRDPLQVEGASCFYYQAFSQPLAQALLSGLTDNRGSRYEVPNYGLFYDSLYMTRIHQAIAVLVEIGFFTNPTEFERLIDPQFQQEAAQRLASALRNYCLT